MQIRVATGADAPEIARVHVASWQVAYRGLMPDAILDSLNVEKRAVRWYEILAQSNGITFVSEADSRITGFCNLVPSHDAEANSNTTAEIAAIYIHPECWRKGVGRDLCRLALQEAKSRNFVSVTLWVLKTNIPALKFYQTMGFAADGAIRTEMLKDFVLHELRLRVPL